jgi:hypothetical protein
MLNPLPSSTWPLRYCTSRHVTNLLLLQWHAHFVPQLCTLVANALACWMGAQQTSLKSPPFRAGMCGWLQIQGLDAAMQHMSPFRQRPQSIQTVHAVATVDQHVIDPFNASLHSSLLAGLDPPLEQVPLLQHSARYSNRNLCCSTLHAPSCSACYGLVHQHELQALCVSNQ